MDRPSSGHSACRVVFSRAHVSTSSRAIILFTVLTLQAEVARATVSPTITICRTYNEAPLK